MGALFGGGAKSSSEVNTPIKDVKEERSKIDPDEAAKREGAAKKRRELKLSANRNSLRTDLSVRSSKTRTSVSIK